MNMYHEEDFYVWAENELNNGPRPGLWTKCTAVSEGDLTKARAMYIRERVLEYKKEYGFIKSETEKIQQQALRVGLQQTQQNLEYEESRLFRIQEIDSEMIEIAKSIEEGKKGNPSSSAFVVIVIWVISLTFMDNLRENLLGGLKENFALSLHFIWMFLIPYWVLNSFYKKSKDDIAQLEYNYNQLAEERDNLS